MRGNSGATERTALLDGVRVRMGSVSMQDAFHRLWLRDRGAAAELLGDSRLGFASLYILRPEIGKLDLTGRLNERCQRALALSADLSARRYRPRPEDRELLRWMFLTGYAQDGLGDCYDGIMDRAAILLIREYRDQTCMQPLLSMIFSRHREGRFTFDAEWAFFGSRDPDCLGLIAHRLDSPDSRDRELARRMLQFLPCMQGDGGGPGQRRRVTGWLRQNRPYLYYTGESGQKGPAPCPFRLSAESMYLQKPLSADGVLPPLTPDEQSLLIGFSGCDDHEQASLGEYSRGLRLRSPREWNRFMRISAAEQVRVVRQGRGAGR